MIVVDANLLLYAYDSGSDRHARARKWWETTLSVEGQVVGLPWLTTMAFLRIVTNPRAVHRPMRPATAMKIVGQWLERPNLIPIQAGRRHFEILSQLVDQAQISGPLMTDAHLAALTLEQGATLATHDKDFLRFAKLKVLFPLDQ